ncbi:MAG: hypothetical protein UX09_C0064G0006 [Candidatus Uhrbacteria bacterium GW2011_GWE2_45_35]|uniref:Uncharacterized protein n=2 Tax=Candidatus Uhriibacteriota TaxID=1752732 RepID=A0A0G1J9A0_9BACT|nr:MAG: hypothetical protein UW63_C0085G0005 [Candidatus Uhrbacteria bacterium GW2011_GWF2_44_350]KKU05870.1 MAG: hypothetical protein UX09_C0064G0006 [Candidatus Uhrbacteria bacterium GW2011_GWE2_45_35]HBR80803.1 hypothetical protein [Candidatus Uhrbacteria bacterium]HCU31375.1 hypothetical protein [Candidatus Uhrbacteria bacterium]
MEVVLRINFVFMSESSESKGEPNLEVGQTVELSQIPQGSDMIFSDFDGFGTETSYCLVRAGSESVEICKIFKQPEDSEIFPGKWCVIPDCTEERRARSKVKIIGRWSDKKD